MSTNRLEMKDANSLLSCLACIIINSAMSQLDFSNIFNETNAIAQQVWLFQRYEQVMEYENTPLIPPPFTPLSYLFLLLKWLWKVGWLLLQSLRIALR